MAEDFLSFKLDAATSDALKPQVGAKLASFLSAEPDDDFLQYTMILAQNGRSKQFIVKDLETFLDSAELAQQFVDWLWDFLERAHEQGVDSVTAPEADQPEEEAPQDEEDEEEQTVTVDLGDRVGSVATVPRPNPSQQRTVASVVVSPTNSDSRKRTSASAGMPAARKLLQSAVSQSLQSTGNKQRNSSTNAPSANPKRQKVIVRRDGSAIAINNDNNGSAAPVPRPKVVRKVNNGNNNNNGMPMLPHGGLHPQMGPGPRMNMNMGGPPNFPFHPQQPLMVSFDANAPNSFDGGFDGPAEWEIPLNRPPPRNMIPPQPIPPRMPPQQQFFNQPPNRPQPPFINRPPRPNLTQQQRLQPPPAPESVPKKVKCTFFPNCTKGPACPFYHPTEVCRFFPNCTYGDSCLNIHPTVPCKFGLKCTNPMCSYSHPPKRKKPAAASTGADSAASSDANAAPCRWGIKCTRDDCKFQHPPGRNLEGDVKFPENAGAMPCKFDPDCKRIRCPFLHPKRDALDQSFLKDGEGLGQKTGALSSSLPSTPPDLKHGAAQLDTR